MPGYSPGGVTGGPFNLPFRGMVRQNRRGLCPVCGVRHAVCDNPAQPALLYPPLDPRSVPLRPELRFNQPTEREPGMALVQSRDLSLRRQEDMTGYVADRRLYLNAEGKVVEAKDPSATTLLVAEGGTVNLERARELGLMNSDEYRKAQGEPRKAAESGYVPSGPGPDDPGAFYDDGTGNTPAGNEGFSDVQDSKLPARERHLANPQTIRVAPSMVEPHEEAGTPRAQSQDDPQAPASQDKTAGVVGDPSMDGEEELRRKQTGTPEEAGDEAARLAAEANERKSDQPAEDKAQRAPETKGTARRSPRGGGSR